MKYQADTHPPDTEIALSLKTVSQPGNTVLAWTGTDRWNDTPDVQLQYAWRLDKGEWSAFSQETHQTLLTLPGGGHTFEVKARDRDSNEDPTPASVQFYVVPPVWRQPWFIGLMAVMCVLVGIAGLQTVRVVQRDRRLREEAEAELQSAHEMQMGLMPKGSPEVEGFDIAGRCIPANHVGGDFFQYFEQDGKLSLTLADVTGHAMEAAIPVVMFDGILDSQLELSGSIENLFGRLNRASYRKLDRDTFVCFTMGELDPVTGTFHLSNGGCPYPYHFRASTGEIVELQVNAYPLGVRPDTVYPVLETQLMPGDRVVFCSDGIIEAENTDGDLLGFEQTTETILKACADGLSAEATINHILEVVSTFRGDVPQGDDMTCVVVRVED